MRWPAIAGDRMTAVKDAGWNSGWMSREHRRGLRILVYSQDGLGLGHMRRTHLIARELLNRRDDASVMTLGDSPLGAFFRLPPRHHYAGLPTITKSAAGTWRSADPEQDLSSALSLRQQLMLDAIGDFRPHLFLIDHMPQGAMGELIPVLRRLKSSRPLARVVLGLRDILDAPDVVRETWEREGGYQALEHYYDAVFVYGQRDLFDIAAEYYLPMRTRENLRYCGYVCARSSTDEAMRIREACLAGTDGGVKLLVALAGGGADGYPVMSTLLDAIPLVQERRSAVTVLITGPFMPVDLQRQLREKAHDLPLHFHVAVSEAADYIQAADLVIGMAGYNTSAEVLCANKAAILIPRPGPSAEQRMRARLFAARGWLSVIDPAELNPERVAAAVLDALVSSSNPANTELPNLQGLDETVNSLLSLFIEKDHR